MSTKLGADPIASVLGVEVDGKPLAGWQFDELRRRHVNGLVAEMLTVQCRAVAGVRGVLGTLSALCEDAIDDEVAMVNPFKGIRLRPNDPRIVKPAKPIRIWTFDQMRAFASGGRPEVRARTPKPPDARRVRQGPARFFPSQDYEAMILTFGFTGLRLGEVLALERGDFDGNTLMVRGSATDHGVASSSRTKNHDRAVPVPPSLAEVISRTRREVDSAYLFPAPSGGIFRKRNFYRDVWTPAKIATGLDPRPHEFRHSYVSHLRAAGIDDADLAKVAGHGVETMLSRYTHPLERSHEAIRHAIG